MVGIPPERALYMTNAKLTAEFLGAESRPHGDERDYKVPDNLNRNYVPDEVFSFFDRLHDKSIPDEEVFKSAIPNYTFQEVREHVENVAEKP